jgi:hypothetical protein
MSCGSHTDWPTLIIAVASLVVAVVAVRFTVVALNLARMDWRQRKWFDLYFQAAQASDFLENFQKQYGATPLELRGMPEVMRPFNELLFLLRKAYSMAVVFPINPEIQEFLNASAVFKDRNEAFSTERLEKIKNAVDGLREKALLGPEVLRQPTVAR